MRFDLLSKFCAVIACALLLCAITITLQRHASGSPDEPPPSVCTYHYLEEYRTSEISLDSNGTMYLLCLGFEEIDVDNSSVETVRFMSSLTAEVTGWMKVSDYFWGTQTYDFVGFFKLRADEFYDPDSGWLVRSIVNEELSLDRDDELNQENLLYYSERNETTYSDHVASTAGFGVYGQGLSTPPGTNWTIWYSIDSAVDGIRDGKSFEERYVDRLMTTYTCTAIESQNVSAGLYDCIKVEYSDYDTNCTQWYCPAIGCIVKSTSSTEDGTVSYTLVEYDDGVESESEAEVPWLVVGVIAAVAAVIVAGVTILLVIRNKNGKRDMPPPQNMEEVG